MLMKKKMRPQRGSRQKFRRQDCHSKLDSVCLRDVQCRAHAVADHLLDHGRFNKVYKMLAMCDVGVAFRVALQV